MISYPRTELWANVLSPCDFNLLLDFDHTRTEPDFPLRERERERGRERGREW